MIYGDYIQHDLFNDLRRQPSIRFDGPDVTADDGKRLASHLDRVYRAMASGEWFTLAKLAAVTRGSEAGSSARLRDLRKARFGGYTIERRRTDSPGIFEYKLVI